MTWITQLLKAFIPIILFPGYLMPIFPTTNSVMGNVAVHSDAFTCRCHTDFRK